MRGLLVLLGVAAQALLAEGIYVLLQDDRKHCFLVEEPQQTKVELRYAVKSTSEDVRLHFTVETPKDGMDLGEDTPTIVSVDTLLARTQDAYVFTTEKDGVHRACLSLEQAPSSPVRLDLQVRVGYSDAYYEKTSKELNLNLLEAMSIRLNDDLTAVLSEADYMKTREVEFHGMSEGINSEATWWPIVQILTLLFTGICQVRYLKRFFKSKKLV
eukprot:CAMPEP_0118864994 /NCGR_PEP_ID=MMETSP1163-20130328/9403_1 /TAXON_ID=124430 /ORGANISM="Phaeomonas parva, Strain CCMP2877" /LENGTH=213 /DNA_ID=CAMNT_0006799181 /DNA_START=106 /DNA_END=747 /DNA_ORIENTATION=-